MNYCLTNTQSMKDINWIIVGLLSLTQVEVFLNHSIEASLIAWGFYGVFAFIRSRENYVKK